MLGRVHLEELGNVEEHGRFLEVGEVLTLADTCYYTFSELTWFRRKMTLLSKS
jgi:hypothetical protein